MAEEDGCLQVQGLRNFLNTHAHTVLHDAQTYRTVSISTTVPGYCVLALLYYSMIRYYPGTRVSYCMIIDIDYYDGQGELFEQFSLNYRVLYGYGLYCMLS